MNRKEFITIEPLVICGVAAVIVIIAVCGVRDIRAQKRDAIRVEDVASIQQSLELFRNTHGRYPTTLEFSHSENSDNSQLLHMGTLPKDPGTHAGYSYIGLGIKGECSGYHLGASLERPHPALLTDIDFDSKKVSTCDGEEGWSGHDLNSVPPSASLRYDVKR